MLWIFGEGSDGEPFSAQAAWYFIQNTGAQFKVLRDYQFEALFGVIDGDGSHLPNQFILDGRTMELKHAVTGNAMVSWETLNELLEAP